MKASTLALLSGLCVVVLNGRALPLPIVSLPKMIGVLGAPLPTQMVTVRPVLSGCYARTVCASPGCIPVPTVLPPVNTSVRGEYKTAGGACGFKRFWWVFWKACGPPLTTGFCPLDG